MLLDFSNAVELKSNGYWGRRSGTIHPTKGLIFPGKRASMNKKESSGRNNKRNSDYRNLKLHRKHFAQMKAM